jgi:hypothetical protein
LWILKVKPKLGSKSPQTIFVISVAECCNWLCLKSLTSWEGIAIGCWALASSLIQWLSAAFVSCHIIPIVNNIYRFCNPPSLKAETVEGAIKTPGFITDHHE